MVHKGEQSVDDAWYMDGGATNHMIDRLDWFDSFTFVPQGHWPVMIVDNRRLWVRGVGSIHIKCLVNKTWEQCTIHRVLYIPEQKKNLFSVGQAADKGFTTTYMHQACYLTSNGGHGKVVLVGK
jgi:hypothetical protein